MDGRSRCRELLLRRFSPKLAGDSRNFSIQLFFLILQAFERQFQYSMTIAGHVYILSHVWNDSAAALYGSWAAQVNNRIHYTNPGNPRGKKPLIVLQSWPICTPESNIYSDGAE